MDRRFLERRLLTYRELYGAVGLRAKSWPASLYYRMVAPLSDGGQGFPAFNERIEELNMTLVSKAIQEISA